MLAGAHWGIANSVPASAPTDGNAYDNPGMLLSTDWHDAIRAVDAASVLTDYLGADFCRVFGLGRKAGRRKFDATVSALEYEWYLRTV